MDSKSSDPAALPETAKEQLKKIQDAIEGIPPLQRLQMLLLAATLAVVELRAAEMNPLARLKVTHGTLAYFKTLLKQYASSPAPAVQVPKKTLFVPPGFKKKESSNV